MIYFLHYLLLLRFKLLTVKSEVLILPIDFSSTWPKEQMAMVYVTKKTLRESFAINGLILMVKLLKTTRVVYYFIVILLF